jgi:hypothetical protein
LHSLANRISQEIAEGISEQVLGQVNTTEMLYSETDDKITDHRKPHACKS